MDLNNKRKTYVLIDREIGSGEIFALLDELNSDLDSDIDNLMNDTDTKFVLEESLEKELDSDNEHYICLCQKLIIIDPFSTT